MKVELQRFFKPSKNNLIAVYIIYLCSVILPPLILVGAAISYMNQQYDNRVFVSHYVFLFRTFCMWCITVFIISVISQTIIFARFNILDILLNIWFISRVVIGFQYLIEDMPHPNRMTLWIK